MNLVAKALSSIADAGARAADATTALSEPVRVTVTDGYWSETSSLVWVAFNDGDGPWQTVDAALATYSFDVRGGRYGLVYVCSTTCLCCRCSACRPPRSTTAGWRTSARSAISSGWT